jgi:hypothetical protein
MNQDDITEQIQGLSMHFTLYIIIYICAVVIGNLSWHVAAGGAYWSVMTCTWSGLALSSSFPTLIVPVFTRRCASTIDRGSTRFAGFFSRAVGFLVVVLESGLAHRTLRGASRERRDPWAGRLRLPLHRCTSRSAARDREGDATHTTTVTLELQ